jgi:hypothetical protein
MPAIFFGHGNPMNALLDNSYTLVWQRIGQQTTKPRAILSISAHWTTPRTDQLSGRRCGRRIDIDVQCARRLTGPSGLDIQGSIRQAEIADRYQTQHLLCVSSANREFVPTLRSSMWPLPH